MKKLLFWLTFPFTGLLVLLVALVGCLCEWLEEAAHKWEGWCFDYKNSHKGMHYKGAGIWTSYEGLP